MIKRTKLLCAFAVFLFMGSLAATGVNAHVSIVSVDTDQNILAETYGDNRRNEAVSILVYTEAADTSAGQEYEKTMDSLITNLEGKFTYENLTDYTQLGSMIEEFDVLLILESELGNYTFADTVNAAWAGILPSFVDDGGIIICMTAGPDVSNMGISASMINGTLMDIYNPELANGHQIDVFDNNDALALNVDTFSGPAATISFDIPDVTKVLEDNTDAKPVAVHKIIGAGHVVLLGFDFFLVEENAERVLANAVRLHKLVLFDDSHGQSYEITGEFNAYAEELQEAGYAVGTMTTFDAAILAACEVLVIPRCGIDYDASDVDVLEEFVFGGGGLFVIGEWGV